MSYSIPVFNTSFEGVQSTVRGGGSYTFMGNLTAFSRNAFMSPVYPLSPLYQPWYTWMRWLLAPSGTTISAHDIDELGGDLVRTLAPNDLPFLVVSTAYVGLNFSNAHLLVGVIPWTAGVRASLNPTLAWPGRFPTYPNPLP